MSAPATATCCVCGLPFTPRRSTRRFCSPRCRLVGIEARPMACPPEPLVRRLVRFLAFQTPIPWLRLFQGILKR
jgi:hypothetical protein